MAAPAATPAGAAIGAAEAATPAAVGTGAAGVGARSAVADPLATLVPTLACTRSPRDPDDPAPLRPVWFALERADADPAEKRRLETGTVPRAEAAGRLREWLRANSAPAR